MTMGGASKIADCLALCLLAVAAPGCASAPAQSTPGPHDFHAARVLSVKNDGGVRPDYVVVRVTQGATQTPVIETRFLVAASEGATTVGGMGAVATVVPRTADREGEPSFSSIVVDSVETSPDVWAVDLPKVDWPASKGVAIHGAAGAALPAKFSAESGRPFDYHADYGVDYVDGGVALTFQLETRADGVVVREVPATRIRLLYGQSALFATRRPPAGAR